MTAADIAARAREGGMESRPEREGRAAAAELRR